ncbi:hypothetical protein JXA84_00930 [candidate division WOR-3 bacterium]|nr:hypothetical protein [candidate division WOR-3 bacterium]
MNKTDLKTNVLAFLFLLTGCFQAESHKKEISWLIEDKTGIAIDTLFTIIVDSTRYTSGAFDSDYTRYIVIQYQDKSESGIEYQIVGSEYYNCVAGANYAESAWIMVEKESLGGVWISRTFGYEYFHSKLERSEPFKLTLDTATNMINFEIWHL